MSSTQLAAVLPLLDERVVSTFIGGPDAGTQTHCHAGAFLNEDQEFLRRSDGPASLPPTGVTEFTVPGVDLSAHAQGGGGHAGADHSIDG